MVDSGSKGKKAYINQTVTMLGQQTIDDTWMKNDFFRRSLPHFSRDDISSEAHGFINRSFIEGIGPSQYYFHSGSGREGVINKTIKTAETGYVQRKFMKIFENLSVCYDGTIRNDNNVIISSSYCGGFDPTFLETQFVDISCNKDNYLENEWDEILGAITHIQSNPEFIKESDKIYSIKLPINFNRYIENFNEYQKNKNKTRKDKHEEENKGKKDEYIYDYINEFIRSIKISKDDTINNNVLLPLISVIRLTLNTFNLKNLDSETFNEMMKVINHKYYDSLINPGENVGSIAGQSLGEPTTQMNLDAFHEIGVGTGSSIGQKEDPSGGVARLKECMNVSRTPKNPSSRLYLKNMNKEQFMNDANKQKPTLIQTKLNDIIDSYKIEFTNKGVNVIINFNVKNMADIPVLDLYRVLAFNKLKNSNSDSDIDYSEPQRYFFETDKLDIKEIKEKINMIIEDTVIHGINNISNCKFITEPKNIIPYIKTIGNNVYELLALDSNIYDFDRFYSNNFWEMYAIYGIEVAKESLTYEFDYLLKSEVNMCHCRLLSSVMTTEGIIMSVDRHGVNKTESGPLGRVTFEETVQQLVQGSVYNDVDYMNGVSANIMFGQCSNMGTNAFVLELDTDKLNNPKQFCSNITESEVNEFIPLLISTAKLFNFVYSFI